ncbi:helix-turn-helix transcriptional regulator [Nonomuraea sp. NPDC049421]|uniref:helix-turn-helix transcriptional regulator n=1 Tax=Nonomuraea sp. NPDC049421 TaxID=3155275 RepID=UPI00341BD206
MKPGSVCHALAKLEAEGLAETHSEERAGDRLRRVHAITPEGRRALRDLLRKALSAPPHSTRPDFALALRWHALLDSGEVRELVAASCRALEGRRADIAAGREPKAGLSPLADALFDNADAHLAADAKRLEDIQRLLGQ